MEEAKPATPPVTDAERLRRQKAVEYARGSAWLEGFVLDADIEALNQRYVNGELTSEELTAAIPAIESRVYLPGPAASPPGRNARRRAWMEQIPGTRSSSQRLFRSIALSIYRERSCPYHAGLRRTIGLIGPCTRCLRFLRGPPLRQPRPCSPVPQAERLYVARDVAALERAFLGLTPQRGMETNDRAAYEASLALPALRRLSGASREAIV
jgi:hypothetical protein